MTARGAAAVAPGVLVAPDGWPSTRAEAAAIILDLLGALDGMRAYADRMWHAGVAHGTRHAQVLGEIRVILDDAGVPGHATVTVGHCPSHLPDLADARAEGARLAAADIAGGASAFAVGWNACLDRLADEVGGRAQVAHPTAEHLRRWTRHAPRCRHGGAGVGGQSCQRAGCLPGTRAAYADPAPWDTPHDPAAMVAKARASWGLA